jgi:SAM-dependent methyltransferase
VKTHYDSIAKVFNKVWQFSDGYKNWILGNIQELLELDKDDILIDIGGGTGTFTSMLKDKSNIKKAICVEPSQSMFQEAKNFKNIDFICQDALSFSKSTSIQYNKILLKEVIHHIENRQKLWKNLYENLPKKSKILIITRPKKIKFPLFNKALEEFSKNQPPIDILIEELEENKFIVFSKILSYSFTLSNSEWYMMIENRFMSDLGKFSNKEINLGISELKNNHKDHSYNIKDDIIFIVATK